MSEASGNSKNIASAIFRQLVGKENSTIQATTEQVDILFQEIDMDYRVSSLSSGLPSKKLQLSYFLGDIDKALWIAKKSSDVDVLKKFSNHRSILVKRAVALNQATPRFERYKIMAWGIKNEDQQTLEAYNQALPLYEVLSQLADTESPFNYATQISAKLNSDLLAKRLLDEPNEEVVRLSLKIPDRFLHAASITAAHEGLAGSLSLTEAVEMSKKVVSLDSESLIKNTLYSLLTTSGYISVDLINQILLFPFKDNHNYHFVAADRTEGGVVELITQRAKDVRSSNHLPGGYRENKPKELNLVKGWDPISVAAARLAGMKDLDHDLLSDLLDIATLPAALNLVSNKSISLNRQECDRIIKLSTNFLSRDFSMYSDVLSLAKNTLEYLQSRVSLSGEQHVYALIGSHTRVSNLRYQAQDKDCPNKFDLEFVKAFLAIPDGATGLYPDKNDTIDQLLYIREFISEVIPGIYDLEVDESPDPEVKEMLVLIIEKTPTPDLIEILRNTSYYTPTKSSLCWVITDYLTRHLGNSQDAWKMFLSLTNDWQGTLQELVATTLACVGIEDPSYSKIMEQVPEDLSFDMVGNEIQLALFPSTFK